MLNYAEIVHALRSNSPATRAKLLADLKEKNEIYHGGEYVIYLKELFPVYVELLHAIPPQFEDNDLNKIRSLIVEILCSFSLNEHVKNYCNELMTELLKVVQFDNEENACVSIKGSFELHKVYRPYLEKHVDPFIEFVTRLYTNVPSIVASTLRSDLLGIGISNTGQQASVNGVDSTNASGGSNKRAGIESLVVLTECPLIVMFLYQVYPNYLTPILSNLITLMIQTLGVNLPVSASNYHVRSKELLSVQVKTLSFVTYFLRPYSELIRPYETSIATSIYSMFLKCPEDAVSIRKELLVATRHIIATEFRKGLFVYLDEFLKENILFGPGKPMILRPLVYTTLADLIQHVRDILSIAQLIRIVDLYSTILQDTSLPSNMHGIAVRVLHYLVEKINQLKTGPNDKSSAAFSLNFIVFKSLVDKIGALRYNIDKYGQVTAVLNNESAYLIDGSSYLWFKKIANAGDNAATAEFDNPLLKFQLPCDVTSKNIKELLKAIVSELHKLIPFVDNKSLLDVSGVEKSSHNNSYDYFDKVRVIGKYLIWTLQCCQIYIRKSPSLGGNSSANDNSSSASSQDISELKEILTFLITSLSMLTTDTFRCVMKARIHNLCEIASNDQVYLLFFNQLFMNNPTLGLHLFDIMCSYFVSKVEIIPSINAASANGNNAASSNGNNGGVAVKTATRSRLSISEDTKQYPFLLRILKNMLQSISKVAEYEKCLITRLPRLLMSLLRSSLVSPTCINQCNMLRLLFRSAPEFKLELFINAITPYFNTIVQGLDTLYHRTTLKSTKNIVVELCLTIPANSKSQTAHLPVLLKYVSIALKEYNELAKIALKSLETWSDFQSGDHFMTVLNALPSNILEDILHGIQRHLKPLPYSQGLLALKLLGKLGGHCKRFLDSIPYCNVNSFQFNSLKYSHSRIVELSTKIKAYNDAGNNPVIADSKVDLVPLVQGACELLFTSIAPNDSDTESEVLTMNSINAYNNSVKAINKVEIPTTLHKYLGTSVVSQETKAMDLGQPPKGINILTEWCLEDMAVSLSESEYSDGSKSLDIKTLSSETNYLSFSIFQNQKQECCKFIYQILLNYLAIPSNIISSKASSPDVVTVDKSAAVGTRSWCNVDLVQDIIQTIFIALIDENIRVVETMESGEFIDGILMHMLVCNGSATDPNSNTESLYQVINNVIILLVIDKRREIRKQGFVVFSKWLHAIDRYENHSSHDTCGKPSTQKLALDDTKVVLRELIDKVISLLLSSRLNDRIVGCKCLCDMSRLFNVDWCSAVTATKVINGLYCALAHPTASINLPLLYDMYETLSVYIESLNMSALAGNLNTLQTIFSGCFHNNPTIRLASILMISKLCEAVGKQELQLFDMMKAHIQGMIADELARMTTQSIIDPGFLYGLTYLFNFGFRDIDSTIISYLVLVLKQNELDQVPIEQVNGVRLDLNLTELINVIGVCTGGKSAANIFSFNKLVTICTTDIRVVMSIYPNLLPCNVMKHLATIHFVESLYVASSAKSGKSVAEMDDINTKTCEFLLKSIISHGWNELSEAASKAIVTVNSNLAAVNCTKSYFEKHVVEDTCKAIFSAMQDIKTATRSLLSSFYALMRALPDVFSYDYYIQRFLNYLKVWSEPSKITSLNSFIPGSEHQVSLAIIMTLLACNMTAPTVANPSKIVLDEFINTVIDIEQAHFRFLYAPDNDPSPYNKLVYDAFLKYPNESMQILINQESLSKKKTIDFLLRLFKSNVHRLDNFVTTFIAKGLPVIKSVNHAANVLVSDIVKDPTVFVMTDIDERTIDTAFNCSVLLRHLLKFVPEILLQAGDLLQTLHLSLVRCMNMISSFMKHNYRPVYISRYYQEIKYITKCLIYYCYHFKKSGITDKFVPQYDILFELVHVLNMNMSSPVDYTYVAEFMRVTLPTLLDTSQLKDIITQYFTEFNTNPRFVFEWKTKSLEVLIIPLLQHYYSERGDRMDDGSDIFDAELMKLVMSEGYNAYASDGTDSSVVNISTSRNNDHDLLKVALLKLSTILLSHCHSFLRMYKKDLIKYPWNCIKAEDNLLKYWSYVSICYFVSAFDSPAKIIIQVYVALLKASSTEGKEIIRIAVDKLLPALSSRLYSDDMFKIIKWTKKILLEEGSNNLPLLTHIWGMISRHSETFFPYRQLLLPQLVTTLSKVGLASTNVPLDSRQMTLTLVDVIIGWEFYRVMKANVPQEAASVNSTTGNDTKRDSSSISDNSDAANKKLKVDTDISIENPLSQPTSTSDGMTNASPRVSAADNSFVSNLPVLLANFVVRLAFKIVDFRAGGANTKDVTVQKLYSRCMHLYKVLIKIYPDVDLKVVFIDKEMNIFAETFYKTRVTAGNHRIPNVIPINPAQPLANGTIATAHALDSTLIAILEFLNISSLNNGDALLKIFHRNLNVLKELLLPMYESDNPMIQKLFRILIHNLHVYNHISDPSVNNSGYMSHLKHLIDKGLRITPPNSGAGQPKASSATIMQNITSNDKDVTRSLSFIDFLSTEAEEWVAYHGTSLVKLCQHALNYHVYKAAKALHSDPLFTFSEQDPCIYSPSVHPTTWSTNFIDSISGVSSVKSNDDSVNMLYLLLKLLYKGLSMGMLTSHRSALLSIISSVVESSDSPLLLSLTMEHSEQWVHLSSDDSYDNVSVLSYAEQWMLCSIICKNIGRFPDHPGYPHVVRAQYLVGKMRSYLDQDINKFQFSYGIKAVNALRNEYKMIGFMSSVDKHRLTCLNQLSATYGSSLYDKIKGFFESDFAQYNQRYILGVLVHFYMDSLAGGHSDALTTKAYSSHDNVDASASEASPKKRGAVAKAAEKEKKEAVFFHNTNPYVKFLRSLAKGSGDGMGLIATLSLYLVNAGDACMCQILSALWNSLPEVKHEELVVTIERFVYKTKPKSNLLWPALYTVPTTQSFPSLYYGDSVYALNKYPSNVVQSILRYFIYCTENCSGTAKVPYLSAEFLGTLSNLYATWSETEYFLEAYRVADGGKGKREKYYKQILLSSIGIWQDLEDLDLVRTAYDTLSDNRSNPQSLTTRIALSLETYGRYLDAQTLLIDAIKSLNLTSDPTSIARISGSDDILSLTQLQIWEKRYIANSKELSEWHVLNEISKNLNLIDTQLEATLLLQDFDAAKALRRTPTVIAANDYLNIQSKLRDITIFLNDNNTNEADRLFTQSIQISLLKWYSLPMLLPGSTSHRGLLSYFHRIVELRESAGCISDIAKSVFSNDKNPLELKVLSTWRNRYPDLSDSMCSWDTIMHWRLNMFKAIKKIQSSTNNITNIVNESTINCLLKILKAARKQSLFSVSNKIIAKIKTMGTYTSTNHFNLTREEILTKIDYLASTNDDYESSNSSTSAYSALQIINNCNSSGFDATQMAELYRLRAICQEYMMIDNNSSNIFNLSDIHASYSQCLQLNSASAKGWLSWGNFCYRIHTNNANIDRGCSTTSSSTTAVQSLPTSLLLIEMSVHCISCIMKSLELAPIPSSLLLLNRVIWLITHEDDDNQTIGNSFLRFLDRVPVWVWLPHISTLIENISRYGTKALTIILNVLASHFPNAAAFSVITASKQAKPVSGSDSSATPLYSDTINVLCKSSNVLYHTVAGVRAYLHKLTTRTWVEEAYLKCHAHCFSTLNDCSSLTATLAKETVTSIVELIGSLDDNYKSTPNAWKDFKEAVKYGSSSKANLSSMESHLLDMPAKVYVGHLRKLLHCLSQIIRQRAVHEQVDSSLLFFNQFSHDCGSPYLKDNIQYRIDIPGQYNKGLHEPRIELHSKIIKILPGAKFCVDNGRIYRTVCILGSDGNVHQFHAVYGDGQQCTGNHIDLVLEKLYMAMNCTMSAYPQCRGRDLCIKYATVLPLSEQVVLRNGSYEDHSLTELHNQFYANASSIDDPIDALSSAMKAKELMDSKKHDQIQHVASCDILRYYLSGKQYTCDVAFTVKKYFASQVGIHSAIQYMTVAPMLPDTLAVTPIGTIVPRHSPGAHWITRKAVNNNISFRYTSNIDKVISNLMLQGVTAVTLGTIIDASVVHSDALEIYLANVLFSSNNIHRTYGSSAYNETMTPAHAKARANDIIDNLVKISPIKQPLHMIGEDMVVDPNSFRSQPIDVEVKDLIVQSSSRENNMKCNLYWQYWL